MNWNMSKYSKASNLILFLLKDFRYHIKNHQFDLEDFIALNNHRTQSKNLTKYRDHHTRHPRDILMKF